MVAIPTSSVPHLCDFFLSQGWEAATAGYPIAGSALNTSSRELGHAAGVVPIGDIDVCVAVNEAAMCSAESGRADGLGIDVVVGPLRFLWIVTEEGNGGVVMVEDCGSTFEFGDN